MNLSLNNEKCFMLRNNRIVLGHHISTFSTSSVEVDLDKNFYDPRIIHPSKLM
jgi:hypothetical protein